MFFVCVSFSGFFYLQILTSDYYAKGRKPQDRHEFVKSYLAEEIDFPNDNEITMD